MNIFLGVQSLCDGGMCRTTLRHQQGHAYRGFCRRFRLMQTKPDGAHTSADSFLAFKMVGTEVPLLGQCLLHACFDVLAQRRLQFVPLWMIDIGALIDRTGRSFLMPEEATEFGQRGFAAARRSADLAGVAKRSSRTAAR